MSNIKNEILAVKELGEKIGYGHLMNLASALWRKNLRGDNYPELGAFVPTIKSFLNDKDKQIIEITENSIKHYDKIIAEEL